MADDVARVAKDNWKIRRRVVFGALGYIAIMLAYIVLIGTDSALFGQVAVGLIGAAVAIIGSYVFGAVWDDNGKRRLMAEREEAEQDEPRRWGRFKI
jgi:peptidoglycan/LPS O-acetylase OafA/YrhL